MLVLGIESSCDETGAALVQDGRYLLSNVVASQIEIHNRYGGVVPEVASRQQLATILPVIETTLEQASCSWEEIDAVAATAVAKIHPIFGHARRVHVMHAGRRIGNAFIATRPRCVVAALRRRNIGGGLLTRNAPLPDEHRVRWIAQIPDIHMLVRVPAISFGLEDGVGDSRIAFPPRVMRRSAVVYDFHDLRRRPWIGRIPNFPISRSVMPQHIPVVLLPARQGIAAAHGYVRRTTGRLCRNVS